MVACHFLPNVSFLPNLLLVVTTRMRMQKEDMKTGTKEIVWKIVQKGYLVQGQRGGYCWTELKNISLT